MNIMDRPEQAPGVCFICEAVNSDAKFIDTFRHFEPGGPTKLNGRKYICSECVADFAHQLGFLSPAEADKVRGDKERAEAERDAAVEAAEASKQLVAAVERVAKKHV